VLKALTKSLAAFSIAVSASASFPLCTSSFAGAEAMHSLAICSTVHLLFVMV
jgi:hypothetical protein